MPCGVGGGGEGAPAEVGDVIENVVHRAKEAALSLLLQGNMWHAAAERRTRLRHAGESQRVAARERGDKHLQFAPTTNDRSVERGQNRRISECSHDASELDEARSRSVKGNDAANVLVVEHVLIALIDLIQRVGVGDHLVEFELTGLIHRQQVRDLLTG